MKINGIDISYYGAKQIKVMPGQRDISNGSELVGGIAVPILCAPDIGLKTYEIVLAVHGTSREAMWRSAAGIVALFENGAVSVKLDGFNNIFQMALTGVKHEEYGPNKDRWHTLILECKGYEHGEEVKCAAGVGIRTPGGSTSEYTDEMIYPMQVERGTRMVLMGIEIEQTYTVESENDTDEPRIIGKRAPILGEIKIEGVCMDRFGNSLGAIEVVSVGDETSIKIEKGTGKITKDSENGWATNHYEEVSVKMPSPPVCTGNGGIYRDEQIIKISAKFYGMNYGQGHAMKTCGAWARYRHVTVRFSYIPIYI